MTLIIQIGDKAHTHAFTEDFTVGRTGTDLEIDDEYVSPRHAVFRPSLQKYWTVEDLDSANGTWLNGRRVRGLTWLFRGDKVKIGHTILIVTPTIPT